MIKNKFVYPTSSYETSRITPARYVHKCDRQADCECVALTSYLLYVMSAMETCLNPKWPEDLATKLEELVYEPKTRCPF